MTKESWILGSNFLRNMCLSNLSGRRFPTRNAKRFNFSYRRFSKSSKGYYILLSPLSNNIFEKLVLTKLIDSLIMTSITYESIWWSKLATMHRKFCLFADDAGHTVTKIAFIWASHNFRCFSQYGGVFIGYLNSAVDRHC